MREGGERAATRPWLTAALAASLHGLGAAALAVALGQIPPLAYRLFGAELSWRAGVRVGWFYTLASIGAGVRIRDPSAPEALAARITVPLLAATALIGYVLYRGGRAAYRRVGSVRGRTLAGALVAPAFVLPIAAGTALVRLDVSGGTLEELFGGQVRIRGDVTEATALAIVLGIGAGVAGVASLARAPAPVIRSALSGGWRAFATALVSALVGVLVAAALHPDAAGAYARAVTESGPKVAAAIVAHHAVLLPNQSQLVLAPSMGSCVGAYGNSSIDLVCAEGFRTIHPLVLAFASADVSDPRLDPLRPWPPWYLAFLLIPLVSTVVGGRHAARGVGDLAVALTRAMGSGVAFAALAGAGSLLASARVSAVGSDPTGGVASSVRFGPEMPRTAVLALLWGLVGGAIGAVLARRAAADQPEPDEPPIPTSV